mgnify:CR=1 FL=1
MWRTLFLLLWMFNSFGQTKLDVSCNQVNNLKNGSILVQLFTEDQNIKLLNELGKKSEAERLEREVYQKNKEIILSFTNGFSFCPVYFFYDHHLEKVRQGLFDSAVFNAKLEFINFKTKSPTFYIAEFSETSVVGIDGLVLFDENYQQLAAPFPFFERQYIFFSLVSLSKGRIIERYAKRLQQFQDYCLDFNP